MIANHGAIPLLDLIENCEHESAVLKKLLNILNLVSFGLQFERDALASFCISEMTNLNTWIIRP